MSYYQEPDSHRKKKNKSWIRFALICNKIWCQKAIGVDKSEFG